MTISYLEKVQLESGEDVQVTNFSLTAINHSIIMYAHYFTESHCKHGQYGHWYDGH